MAKRELASRELLPFVKYNFPSYKVNWHHKVLIDKLEAIERGDIKRLIVMMPPRHGKSELCSIQFPAWYLGKNPTNSIITSTYSGDLSSDFGRMTRNLVKSKSFTNIFDETQMKQDSKAKTKWSIKTKDENREGSYFAVGVGGSITGRGADVLVIDDPYKNREEADSKTVRDKVWNWWRSTARTRLSPKGAVILILTRWHNEDIAGKLIEESGEKWEIFKMPAIATEDEKHRKKGEPLWNERYSLEDLMDIKQDVGPYEWSALYQQEPVDEASQEFKKDWIQHKDMIEVKTICDKKVATIDPGFSGDEENDRTGVVENYIDGKNNWHFKAYGLTIDAKQAVDLIFDLHEKGFEIAIEKEKYTIGLKPWLDELAIERNEFPYIKKIKHTKRSKETRIRSLVPRYKASKIYHIKDHCDDLEQEMLKFPKSDFDDVLDSASMQIEFANNRSRRSKNRIHKPGIRRNRR